METGWSAVLFQAIEMENKIREYYLGALAKTQSEVGRDLLQFLADQELRHIEIIRHFEKSMATEGAKCELPSGHGIQQSAQSFFSNHKAFFQNNTQAFPSDVEVYRLGKEIEHKGYAFYREQEDTASDEPSRTLFHFLAEEEIRHHELLDEMSVYFLDPGAWFLSQEKWFFEG